MMTQEQDYQQVVQMMTHRLNGLFAPFPGVGEVARGGAEIPADVLAGRAEETAEAVTSFNRATAAYLDADQQALREGAELKLLAGANAGVAAARALLAAAESEPFDSARQTVRSGSGADVQQTVRELEEIFNTPLDVGLEPFLVGFTVRGERDVSARDFRDGIVRAVDQISESAAELTVSAANTLLFMDQEALKQGVSLISQDIAETIDRMATGLRDVLARIFRAAIRIILEAYDVVLTLLGKDLESKARQKVREWLDDIAGEDGVDEGLAQRLVDTIFATSGTAGMVDGWLSQRPAEPRVLADTLEKVNAVTGKYDTKAEQLQRLIGGIGLVKVLRLPVMKVPQVQAVLAGVMLGLMGYVLFSGYDHVDSGSATFFDRYSIRIPDRVEGVRATVQKGLGLVNA